MKYRKITAASLVVLGIVTALLILQPLEFKIGATPNFSLNYYMQFAPLIISVLLIISGVYLLFKHSKTNLALAIFGYTALQTILLDWLGIVSSDMNLLASILFLIPAVFSLWISHRNVFQLEKLSYTGVFISILVGAFDTILLYWMIGG